MVFLGRTRSFGKPLEVLLMEAMRACGWWMRWGKQGNGTVCSHLSPAPPGDVVPSQKAQPFPAWRAAGHHLQAGCRKTCQPPGRVWRAGVPAPCHALAEHRDWKSAPTMEMKTLKGAERASAV